MFNILTGFWLTSSCSDCSLCTKIRRPLTLMICMNLKVELCFCRKFEFDLINIPLKKQVLETDCLKGYGEIDEWFHV